MKKIIFVVLSLLLSSNLGFGINGVDSSAINKAVSLYESGRYPEATDAFIDILHYGNAEQKEIANRYINRISYDADKNGYRNPAADIDKSENGNTERKPYSEFEREIFIRDAAGDIENPSDEGENELKDLQKETSSNENVENSGADYTGDLDVNQPQEILTKSENTVPDNSVSSDIPAVVPTEEEKPNPDGSDSVSPDTEKDEMQKPVVKKVRKDILFKKPGKIPVISADVSAKSVEMPLPKIKHSETTADKTIIVYPQPKQEQKKEIDRQFVFDSINRKIEERRGQILTALSEYAPIDVVMSGGMPNFVVINPKGLFSKTINFQHHTWYMISYVAGLLYTLRDGNFTILPQGVFSGENTLLDMRRAMALHTAMINEGISKARIKVALKAPSDYSPERFNGADGIIIAISYNKTYALKKLVMIKKEQGPEITLGVYPNAINPLKGRGVIVEFAVIETENKINDWKFQIMRSDKNGGLTEVVSAQGSKPAFHQIYWNARQYFTGPFYPGGKYICMLSASDVSGGKNTLKKYFTVVASGRSPAAIAASVSSDKEKASIESVKKGPGYSLDFVRESVEIEEEQINKIEDISQILSVNQKSRAIITGYGYSGEINYEDYALRRANVIKRMFVDEYGISSDRIKVNTAVSEYKPYVLIKLN